MDGDSTKDVGVHAVVSTPDTLAARAAASDCTILVTGETGAGKGHLARRIHALSHRATRAFVPVNCGAIPHDLIDSHLFGHMRGAFTGATQDHSGLVRAADGGTLLLDEVGELPLTAQTRLLRMLDDGEVQPVGSPQPTHVDVRVIAATNADLTQAVADGRFREDLYFRLDVIQIPVPPLRDRPLDVRDLVESFGAEFAETYDRRELVFAATAMAMLERHRWPGNIRQLRAVLERLYVLCPVDRIGVDELGEYAQLRDEPGGESTSATGLREMRLALAREALAAAHGSVSRAAARLGVHRSTLYRWLGQSAAKTAECAA